MALRAIFITLILINKSIMAVSGKSIIHYTRTLDNLKGILTSGGFRLKYCLESINITSSGNHSAFPMVCFCDLPLTHAKDHIDHYGAFGIGLSKKWARDNQLNPVLYLENGSSIGKALLTILIQIQKRRDNKDGSIKKEEIEKERLALVRTLAFSKPHVGPLIRDNELIDDNYVFYDEREWRYVPDEKVLGDKHPLSIVGTEYTSKKEDYNKALSALNLNFSYDDISYILVESQSDILPIIKCLQEKYVDELTQPKIQELCTKIITKQQIINDF